MQLPDSPSIPPVPTWFLYMLECVDGSIYTGITTDVARRYATHLSGKGARYTRAHPPKKLLAVFAYPDRSTASCAEYAIKQLSAMAKKQFASTAIISLAEFSYSL